MPGRPAAARRGIVHSFRTLAHPLGRCYGRLMRARMRYASLLVGAASALGATAAQAAAPNPSANMPIQTPASCNAATSVACENAVVVALDNAHTALGLGPYTLPSDFDTLPPVDQLLILSNLDRVAYGMPPISGLSPALDSAAQLGVANDADPDPSSALPANLGAYGWSSNWAGGFANAPLAYYMWMYDDGVGSPNLDCSNAASQGCWGHRQDVLAFSNAGALVMGAATGVDHHGMTGYALTIVGTASASTAWTTLNYTWTQALADIGGSSPGGLGSGSGAGSAGSGSGAGGSGSGSGAGSGTGSSSGGGTGSGSGSASGAGSSPGAGAGTRSGPSAGGSGSAGAGTAGNAGPSGVAGAGTPTSIAAPLAPIAVIAHAKVSPSGHAARFVLRASGAATGFECALVHGAGRTIGATRPHFVACASVRVYTHLHSGRYTFYARALGATGSTRRTVRRSFSIR